jgi:hypothetical protein
MMPRYREGAGQAFGVRLEQFFSFLPAKYRQLRAIRYALSKEEVHG